MAYRAVIQIVGAYVAARLAPDRPMAHALLLSASVWLSPLPPRWRPGMLTSGTRFQVDPRLVSVNG